MIYDVIIIGGGVIGLTAAISMQQKGYTVALLDAGSLTIDAAVYNPKVYAINSASVNLFKSLDIWHRISPAAPYQFMSVWDAKSGACIEFDARLMAASELGFIIEETILRQALLEKIQSLESIHLYPESLVNQVNPEDKSITVHANTQSWIGKLLLVTDGANSSTRELLKVPLTSWPYHQEAIVATVKTTLPHQQTARQVFHPEGPLAFLPMSDPHTCSIVWTTSPDKAKALMHLSESEFNQSLTTAFGKKLGEVSLQSMRNRFPLIMRHAKHYVGKNWLLAGDAAHTIHPLAGLGLNLGLADITTFMECLSSKDHLPVSPTILQMYQRARKNDTWKVIVLMEGLKRLFASEYTPLVTLRSLGLRAFDGLASVKRLLVSQAMGVK